MPVCVVGAEEAAPIFAQVKPLQRLTGLLYFPITPTFPHGGPLGMLGYLPAKFKIRFLEPIHFEEEGMHEDKALVQTVAHEVRARIQENLFDMVDDAQVGVVRMSDVEAHPHHGPLRPTGATALARALEQNPEVEAIIGVDARGPAGRARAHRVRARRHAARAAAPDRRGGARSTRSSTRAWSSTRRTTSPRARAREQRHRDDEHPRRVLGQGLDGPQVHLQVLDALLRLRAGRPGVLHRVDAAGRTRRARRSSATSSRPRRRSATSARSTRTRA